MEKEVEALRFHKNRVRATQGLLEFLFILYHIKHGDAIFSYGFQYNEDGENASERKNAQELTLD